MGGAEGKRHRDPEPPTQITGGQDRLLRRVDLGAGPCGVIAEGEPGLGQRGAAGRPRQQLHAQLRLEPQESPADDRLGDAEAARGGRNPARVGDLHECPQFLDVQVGALTSAFPVARHSVPQESATVSQIAMTLSASWQRRNRRMTPGEPICLAPATEDVSMKFRNGLASLLRPEDSVLVLIDHQPYQLANLNSHDPHMAVNNATALAKSARVFGVPTILTSVVADRGGLIFPQITDIFPGQEVIDRTFINTWEDRKVVEAVKATGRKQLIIAGLWTEICVAMPVIQALGEGWDVTVITDASGAVSVEAHEVAIQRMIMAGANMMTWLALAAEWQRDWARADTAAALTEVIKQHAAGSGIAYLWEQQLLNTPVPGAQTAR